MYIFRIEELYKITMLTHFLLIVKYSNLYLKKYLKNKIINTLGWNPITILTMSLTHSKHTV